MLIPRRLWMLNAMGAIAGLGACSTRSVAPPDSVDWHDFPIPGKRSSRYLRVQKGGRLAYEAQADRSASMWRQRLDIPPERLGEVTFSWWVDRLLPQANVAEIEREDAVARVIFGFDGDRSRLSARTRAMFELAEMLTGEEPPYATLMYVWDTRLPVDTVVTNPRSDRIRKWVLDSGPSQLGRWRDHRRPLAQDFQTAFGEPPGRLMSVALMTDADNTQGSARTWYGPLHWE
jgi:hypothetical protein